MFCLRTEYDKIILYCYFLISRAKPAGNKMDIVNHNETTPSYTSPTEHRKRIAVFGSGWSGEYLAQVLAGIIENSYKENLDIFTFVNFSINAVSPKTNFLEVEFFKLPPLDEFDGVILLANSFNQKDEFDYLTGKIKEYNLPAISVEYELDGIPSVISDNYSGMYSLCEHIIKEHNARNIVFVSGPSNHAESQVRHTAVAEAMKKNGLTLTPENVLPGNWGKDTIPNLIDGWLEYHGNVLPDAFVCANDIMAMAVCEQVRSLGYDVPTDVIVTGYDCIGQAQNYYPPVTSVSHEWFTMGQKVVDELAELLKGKEVPILTSLSTKLVTGGTCGCSALRSITRKNSSRALTDIPMDPMSVDSHFRHIMSSVRRISDDKSLHNSLGYLLANGNNKIEGTDFGLYLYPEFFTEDPDLGPVLARNHHLLERIVSFENKESMPVGPVCLNEALFKKSDNSDKPMYQLFLPLHSVRRVYGFASLNGPLNVATENQYYMWTMHMIQTLEQVESNITISTLYKKMERLSVTDPLTEVYNRSGCERISYPMLVDWGREGGESILMLVDVDRMKLINDLYGHANGDKALKVVAESLKQSLPKDFIISRFGGDEFFVAGKLEENHKIDPKALIRLVESSIREEANNLQLNFTVTASIGYTIISPKTVSDIEHAVVQADIDMYTNKKIHHLNN